MKASFLRAFFAFLGMVMLIVDSRTALYGAAEGVQLIIHTAIPALFPFFFLTILLTSTQSSIHYPILRHIGSLFCLPAKMDHLLLPAFLGGYPSGAQAVAAAWEQGLIPKKKAEQLLGFCSNAGPAFIFGILTSQFPKLWMAWLLWALHIAGALAAAHILPNDAESSDREYQITEKTLSEVLSASIKVMGNVCGWLMLFRILLAFLERWILWILPPEGKIIITGILELTNGCCLLYQIEDVRLRFVICTVLLSLGGLCVLLQTQSVAKRLSLRSYVTGKLIQALFSGCIAAAIMYRSFYLLLPLLLMAILLLKRKNSSSIPALTGV